MLEGLSHFLLRSNTLVGDILFLSLNVVLQFCSFFLSVFEIHHLIAGLWKSETTHLSGLSSLSVICCPRYGAATAESTFRLYLKVSVRNVSFEYQTTPFLLDTHNTASQCPASGSSTTSGSICELYLLFTTHSFHVDQCEITG